MSSAGSAPSASHHGDVAGRFHPPGCERVEQAPGALPGEGRAQRRLSIFLCRPGQDHRWSMAGSWPRGKQGCQCPEEGELGLGGTGWVMLGHQFPGQQGHVRAPSWAPAAGQRPCGALGTRATKDLQARLYHPGPVPGPRCPSGARWASGASQGCLGQDQAEL